MNCSDRAIKIIQVSEFILILTTEAKRATKLPGSFLTIATRTLAALSASSQQYYIHINLPAHHIDGNTNTTASGMLAC